MSDDVLKLALQDSTRLNQLSEDGVSQLSRLALSLLAEEADLAHLESQVEAKKATVNQIKLEQLPKLMSELGVKNYTMEDGSILSVKRDFSISLKEDDQDKGLDWLEGHGHGGIVKVTVTVSFGKGEYDQAKDFERKIRQLTNHPVEVKRGVHPQTLKAWARELRSNEDLAPSDRPPEKPEGPFTVFDYSKAEVKLPKVKKNTK